MGTNTTGPRKPASLPTDDVLEELYEAAQRSDFETMSVPTRALEGLLADLIGRRFRDRCEPKPPKTSPKLESRLDYVIDGQLAFSLVIHEAGEGEPSYDAQRYLEAVCDRRRNFMRTYTFDQGLRTDAEHAALADGVLSWTENNKGKLP